MVVHHRHSLLLYISKGKSDAYEMSAETILVKTSWWHYTNKLSSIRIYNTSTLYVVRISSPSSLIGVQFTPRSIFAVQGTNHFKFGFGVAIPESYFAGKNNDVRYGTLTPSTTKPTRFEHMRIGKETLCKKIAWNRIPVLARQAKEQEQSIPERKRSWHISVLCFRVDGFQRVY